MNGECKARKSRLVERVEELEKVCAEMQMRERNHTERISVLEEQVLERDCPSGPPPGHWEGK